MRILLVFLITLATLPALPKIESIHYSPPLSVGIAEQAVMSNERLSSSDDVQICQLEENRIPAAVARIAIDGQIVYHKAFGLADNLAAGR